MRTILLLIFLCISITSQAQLVREDNSIGVTFSGLGKNEAFFRGSPSFSGQRYYSLGVIYVYPISRRFDLEVGIEYRNSSFHINPLFVEEMDMRPYIDFSFIEVLLTTRFNFWRHFFLNGGLLVNFEIAEINRLYNQSGIGAMLGVGAKYDFKSIPIGLFINPYLRYRPFIPFSGRNLNLRTAETGFRVGIVYNF